MRRPVLALLVGAALAGSVAASGAGPGAGLAAPAPAARWEVAPAAPRVGDPITARLAVTLPEGAEVLWARVEPAFEGLALTATAPLSAAPSPAGDGQVDAGQVDGRVYTLVADLPGAYGLPALALPYTGPDGREGVAKAPGFAFTVAGAFDPADPPPPAPAKPPVPVPPPWGLYAAVAGALGALLAGAGWLWRRRRAAPVAAEPPPEAPPAPDRVALERLAGLDPEALEPRAFYGVLSEVARGYLEDRFGVPARTRTSSETAVLLDRHVPVGAPIAEWLRGWDLVKFARHAPPPEEARAALEAVRGWVRATGGGPGVGA